MSFTGCLVPGALELTLCDGTVTVSTIQVYEQDIHIHLRLIIKLPLNTAGTDQTMHWRRLVLVLCISSCRCQRETGLNSDYAADSDSSESQHDFPYHLAADYQKRNRPIINDSAASAGDQRGLFRCRQDLPPPTGVFLSIQIADVSKVTTRGLTITMHLRYHWQDPRYATLDFPAGHDHVDLPATATEHLWTPDLFIPNAEHAFIPNTLVPSNSLRIFRNLTVQATQQLVSELSCPFDHRLFPMDRQVCDLTLHSFSYSPCELDVRWTPHRPLVYRNAQLSQFTYRAYRASPRNNTHVFLSSGQGSFDRAQVHVYIRLQRRTMLYILQVYMPSVLFVTVSWISFLIPREMSQARMLLTINILLTMVALFAANSEVVPKTSYVKALDVWMCTCTFLSFVAVVEVLLDMQIEVLEEAAAMASHRKSTYVAPDQYRRPTVMEIFTKYVQSETGEPPQTPETPAAEPAAGVDHSQVIASNLPMLQALAEGRDAAASAGRQLTERVAQLLRRLHRSQLVAFPAVFVVFNVVYWSTCYCMARRTVVGEEGELIET